MAPWWLIVTGTLFAIVVAKHLYGAKDVPGRHTGITGVDAALVAPASISGTVTIPSWVDRSAGTITVDVLRAGSPDTLYARTTVVMASLTYSVGGLPPGSYKLRFGSTGLPVQTQWWKGAKGPADATAVVVGARLSQAGDGPAESAGRDRLPSPRGTACSSPPP